MVRFLLPAGAPGGVYCNAGYDDVNILEKFLASSEMTRLIRHRRIVSFFLRKSGRQPPCVCEQVFVRKRKRTWLLYSIFKMYGGKKQ